MSEKCPLSSWAAPGFVYGENIPDICVETCEELWDEVVNKQTPDHEKYPSYIIRDDTDCAHTNTEHGSISLQAVAVGNSLRLYTTTEKCMECNAEIAEDSWEFNCPNQ